MDAIVHPKHILFVGKTGCNTNFCSDKQEGGTKYVVACGTNAKCQVTTNDLQYTLLPFVARMGVPVIFATIFTSSSKHVLLQ